MDAGILEKYQSLPDDLQKEVADFIEFLGNKYQKQSAAQSSLAQKRTALFGNAKGLITILPGFENLPDGFEEYN